MEMFTIAEKPAVLFLKTHFVSQASTQVDITECS